MDAKVDPNATGIDAISTNSVPKSTDGLVSEDGPIEGLDDEVNGEEFVVLVRKRNEKDALPEYKIKVNKMAATSQSKVFQVTLSQDPNASEIPILADAKCKASDNEKLIRAMVEYINAKGTSKVEPIPQPLRSSVLKENENCDEWDSKFVDQFSTMNELYQLANIADYYQIDALFHLMCAKVASEIKGCAASEIKDRLSNDHKPKKESEKKLTLSP